MVLRGIKRTPPLSRRLTYLACLTFTLSFVSGLTGPIFPLHAQSLGASYQQVGIMAAMGSMIHALSALQMGRLADVAGSEFMFFVAALTASLAGAAYVASVTLPVAAIGKALDSLFIAVFWPALESASHASGSSAGHSMGVVYTAYPIATFTASVITGWISGKYGYRASFGASLAVAVCAAFVVRANMTRWKGLQAAAVDRPGKHSGRRIRPGRRFGFAAALLSCFGYCILVGLAVTFIPLLAEYRGMSVQLVGLLVGVFWLGRTIASFPAGALSERLGRGAVTMPAFMVGTVGAMLTASAQRSTLMFIGVALTGLCSGAVAPVAMALGAECSEPWAQGWGLGLCETFCGIGFIAAGLVGGILAGHYGAYAPFASAGCALLATVGALAILFLADAKSRPA